MLDPTNRRTFLKLTSAGVATATALGGAPALAAKGANEKLVVALIGCGGRGMGDAGQFQKLPNVEVAYVCDVDQARLALAAKNFNVPAGQAVNDLRRVLDQKSVDAVIVATPDHWHSLASILACDAGKHVYVEKPISHNIREGRLLVEASARNKTLVQHGTQSRSTSTMIEAVKRLREGIIGDVLVAKCWNIQRRGLLSPGKDTSPPPGFDYDSWVGPATMIPYRTNRVHQRWTMWYHFGVGEAGNDGVHDIDYTRWGLGVETHPTNVSANGGKFHFADVEQKPQDDAAHVRNFCDCIRNGTKPNADALTGHLSTSLAHLANIATRVGRSLTFDPQKEQIIGDTEANALIRREYRDHWGTPRGA